MLWKPNVKLHGMNETILRTMIVFDNTFRDHGLHMLVTSANDSHSKRCHCNEDGTCDAFDCRLASRLVYDQHLLSKWNERTSNIDRVIHRELVEAVASIDGSEHIQVLLETHQESPWDWHYHAEYDVS